jgi:hypothetical protein
MTDINFEPQSANLVVAHHAEMGPYLMLNYYGRYADGSDVRVPGLPEDVQTMVSVREFNEALRGDQGTIGKLSAPAHNLFSFDIELDAVGFEALLKCFQAQILPFSIHLEVPGLEMPAGGGFYWRDIGQAMPIAGVQFFL